MEKMQDRVLRMALIEYGKRTATEYLKGEIGVSTVRERDEKSKLR